jgi:hypothetical protein
VEDELHDNRRHSYLGGHRQDDMAIGECIDTIGDSNVHKPGERARKGQGYRKEG